MKLSTSLRVKGDRIDYSFEPASGLHSAWFAKSGRICTSSCPGGIANELVPFRGHREVDELFSWLVK